MHKKKLRPGRVILLFLIAAVIIGLLIFGISRIFKNKPHVHTPAGSGCLEDTVCRECGEVLEKAAGHEPGDPATCRAPQVCLRCGEVLAPKLEHTPLSDATCTEASVCSVCGETVTPALGHDCDPATCTEASVCRRCGETVAPAAGHSYVTQKNGDKVCSVCGNTVKAPVVNDPTGKYVPETQSGGHYNQTIKESYYSKQVLVCGDYALEYFDPGTSGAKAWAKVVNEFKEKYPGLRVGAMVIPKNCGFNVPSDRTLQDKSQRAYIDATYALLDEDIVRYDAMSRMMAHKDEYLFYRTDHHWTSLGAYYAFTAWCETEGLKYPGLGDYETYINTGLKGSLCYYAGYPAVLETNPDYTVVRVPVSGYTMTQTTDGRTFEAAAVNTKGLSYAQAFINGDQAVTHIETSNKNGVKLLMFKDSYGNAMVPYLIDVCEEIVVVDPRYGSEPVSAMIEKYGINTVLFADNIQAVTEIYTELRAKALS